MSDKKIKVAHFGLYFPHYREDLLIELSKNKNFEFYFYGDQKFGGGFHLLLPCEKPYILFNTKVIRIKIFNKYWYIIPRAFKSLIKGEYDVYILSNRLTELPSIFIPLFVKLFKRKIIIWGHGKINRNSYIEYFLRRLLIKYSTACIFYNDNEKNFWMKKGINNEKLFVAKNTLNTVTITKIKNNLSSQELKEFAKRHNLLNRKILIFSARLQREKNPFFIIEITDKLKNIITNLLTLIIGAGPEKEILEVLIKKRELNNYIHLLGEIYDEYILAKYFLNSHVYVIPSAAGLSILHAFCYGLPVVTDDDFQQHGPEIQALKNGINGFICRKNNIDDFINKLSYILIHEEKRLCLSRYALNTICEYNVNSMANSIINAVSSIVKE